MNVERLVRLPVSEIRRVEGQEVMVTPDGAVPLVALARLLPPLAERPVSETALVLLLRDGERRLAVVVDELLNEQELVIRPLGRIAERLPLLSGGAVLSSGRVTLMLNISALISSALGHGARSGITRMDAAPAIARRRILVADDSITTRALEQSVLEAAGYHVITAVDGADAWRLLQERGGDAVVTDVEMPRMDGFELCRAIRESKRFRNLPVILVSALESPVHRSRGLEVGADAYLGKSSFDQQNLLETLKQLVGGPA